MHAATSPSDVDLPSQAQAGEDAVGLPGWVYFDPEFFALEQRAIFRRSWQLVCHVNDIPQRGDYHCLDLFGESHRVKVTGPGPSVENGVLVRLLQEPSCTESHASSSDT